MQEPATDVREPAADARPATEMRAKRPTLGTREPAGQRRRP